MTRLNFNMFKFPRVTRLPMFQSIHDVDWSNLKVLDYGGNHGNLLKDGIESGQIKPENYTCLDVDEGVLTEEQQKYPEAKFIVYDRKNPVYNVNGKDRIPFPFDDNSFDIVCSYSLHTHCSYEDFVFDLAEMKRVSKNNVIMTSIFTPQDYVLDVLKTKRYMDYDNVHIAWEKKLPLEKYRYYIDADRVGYSYDEYPDSCDFLVTCYNKDWLKEQHPEIEICDPFSKFHQTMVVMRE